LKKLTQAHFVLTNGATEENSLQAVSVKQAVSFLLSRYRVALSKPPEHRDTASSGFVPRLRLRDITSERFSGVKMSAIGGEDRAIFDPRKWMGENGHFCL
jgi:hypothetical protein